MIFRVNLPVQLMEFTGYEFKAQSGMCYPGHEDVLKYMNDFADHYGLRNHIKVSLLHQTGGSEGSLYSKVR